MKTKQIISITTSLAIVTSMALAIPTFAQNKDSTNIQPRNGHLSTNRNPGSMRPGIFGTVTAISGNTITINSHQGFGSTTKTTSYSIDASSALVKKNNATSTISSITVGDSIFAQGAITGTNVKATTVLDVVMNRPGNNQDRNDQNKNGQRGPVSSSTPTIIGNGQPVIAGTVSTINGSTITVTTSSNTTYTIDASNSKILQGQNTTSPLSNIVVGDKILVQGTINGTSVTASTIIDQTSTTKNAPVAGAKSQPHGILENISQFFMHIFGF